MNLHSDISVVGLWRESPCLPVVFVLCCLPWLALLGWLTSVAWFLCDDAFISFRYVRNLLEGHGLVFNPGEYVEGYSNFLWVLELAALWGLFGLRPEDAAPWLSVACTAGTLATMLWWVAHIPGLRHRRLVAWMALGLVCSSATFAVWTSGGGLETRQFTFFVVLAVVCLSLYRHRRSGLLAASLSLAAAAYTRPEGPLIAACCFGWFAIQRMVETGRLRPDRRLVRELAYLVAPFVMLVAAHFLFRYAYYGEWLPNTYYAKHVRAWYEAGFRYLWAATLETGLYLLLPLAFVALRARWKTQRDLAYALPLLCILPHMAYIMRIGGDHFEYRPLDFYWPLLAVPAAVGIVWVGDRIRTCLQHSTGRGIPGVTLALFFAVVFYAGAMQGALLFAAAKVQGIDRRNQHIVLDEENAGWMLAAPGMFVLNALSTLLRGSLHPHFVGARFVALRELANWDIRRWQPYEAMEREVIPHDAVMAITTAGIRPYYVPDLTIIDRWGLTDATIARNPVTPPNSRRTMGHDRRPPSGYLEERGVNFAVHPPAFSEAEALQEASYAVPVGPNLWMPFSAADHQWAAARFAGRLQFETVLSTHGTAPVDNRWIASRSLYEGERFIGNFEHGDGFDGWQREGDAVTNHGQHEHYVNQRGILGNKGPGFLTSFHPSRGDGATGTARSPEFTATEDHWLAFLIAGGKSDGVGLRLWADDAVVGIWHGRNSERFTAVVHPLSDVVGKTLKLELFDSGSEIWDHIMLDHIMLVRREAAVGG